MLTHAQIREVCNKYKKKRDDRCYFNGNIPADKLKNARNSMNVPESEKVFLLIDNTVWRGAREGLLITERGLYSKCPFNSPDYLDWEAINDLDFAMNDVHADGTKSFIRLDSGGFISFSVIGTSFVVDFIIPMLSDFKALLRNPDYDINEMKDGDNADEWHIAIGDEQKGIFTKEYILKLLKSGKLDATKTLIWKDGMDDWVEIKTLKEFAIEEKPVNNKKAPPPPPKKTAKIDDGESAKPSNKSTKKKKK